MKILWVLALAIAWTAMVGELSVFTLGVGAILGFIVLMMRRQIENRVLIRIWRIVLYFLYFLWKFLLSVIRVSMDILTPNESLRTGVVAIPLDVKGDFGITLLANSLTLTPGSVTMDISDDRTVLYLHTMHLTTVEEVRRDVKEGFERRIIEIVN